MAATPASSTGQFSRIEILQRLSLVPVRERSAITTGIDKIQVFKRNFIQLLQETACERNTGQRKRSERLAILQ